MVTIYDVARRAGVSKSAVSRVINYQPYVAEGIRQRVQAAIEELDFRPNSHARSLRTAQTHVLGLLVPALDIPAVPQILQGASTAAHKQGYLIAISDAHEDPELWAAYLDNLLSRGIDGLLCYDSGAVDDLLRPVLEAGLPTMILNRRAHPSAGTLAFDHHDAFAAALRDLVDHGHRRIALIASRRRSHWADSLRDELSTLRVPHYPELLRQVDSPDDARQAIDQLMAEADPPTAVIVVNAYNASAAGSQLVARGYQIPRDVSLISTGESDWTRNANPPVSVVRSPFTEGAAAVVELLIRQITGDESAPRNVTMKTDYVHRGSVGSVPEGA
ncbi:MAG: LacI family DNA-binding transcriptional regulator [Chloroflexi bacterium]|nr:LacI family DNA-binding transcriptional regulator [Chloroflexota bacterium]